MFLHWAEVAYASICVIFPAIQGLAYMIRIVSSLPGDFYAFGRNKGGDNRIYRGRHS
jgi:hypothetical protein